MLAVIRRPALGVVFLEHIRHAAREIRAALVIDPVVNRLAHRPIESLDANPFAVLLSL